MGDPKYEEVWEKLDDVVDKIYRFKNQERGLKILATFVDSGGNKTQDVYKQCAKRKGKRVFAIKGKSRAANSAQNIPYTQPPRKIKIIKDGKVTAFVQLYTIGVDAGKREIMDAIKVQEPGAKYCHFPVEPDRGYDERFFNGLMSETEVPHTINGRTSWKWEVIPGHERNEPLDCRNYANAAFRAADIPDLFAVERRLKNPQKEKERPKRKRRKSYTQDAGEW